MRRAIDETNRRRAIQAKFNKEHGITPRTIYKSVEEILSATRVADARPEPYGKKPQEVDRLLQAWAQMSREEKDEMIRQLETQMTAAAAELEFEKAAELRDRIEVLRDDELPRFAKKKQ